MEFNDKYRLSSRKPTTKDHNDEIVRLMSLKGYHSLIKSRTIFYHRSDMLECQYKINLHDIGMDFEFPEEIVRYLVSIYELIHKDQIEILEKIKFREERLDSILKESKPKK